MASMIDTIIRIKVFEVLWLTPASAGLHALTYIDAQVNGLAVYILCRCLQARQLV